MTGVLLVVFAVVTAVVVVTGWALVAVALFQGRKR